MVSGGGRKRLLARVLGVDRSVECRSVLGSAKWPVLHCAPRARMRTCSFLLPYIPPAIRTHSQRMLLAAGQPPARAFGAARAARALMLAGGSLPTPGGLSAALASLAGQGGPGAALVLRAASEASGGGRGLVGQRRARPGWAPAPFARHQTCAIAAPDGRLLA